MLLKTMLCVGLTAGTLATAHAVNTPLHRRSPSNVHVTEDSADAVRPVLTHAPSSVDTRADQPSTIALDGRYFDSGISVTFRSAFYICTFGPRSLTGVSDTALHVDAASLPDGRYAVSVKNRTSQPSNELVITVQHGPSRPNK